MVLEKGFSAYFEGKGVRIEEGPSEAFVLDEGGLCFLRQDQVKEEV